MKLSEAVQAQPKPLILLEGLALASLIGLLDAVSGWDVSLFLFYGVPILLVAWYCDRASAIGCALLCGVAWYAANYYSHSYDTISAYTWAALNRWVYLTFVAIGGAALRQQQEEMKGRVEALTRTRELEQEIVRVSEREQMRIGQDLHDGLCQNLAAIDCAAACLRADLAAKSLPETETAGVIQKLLKQAVVEARNLARGIFPVQMDAEGLPAALEELVGTMNLLRQVPVSLDVKGEVRVPDPQVAMHIYRIAQEALSNALRHSGGTRVDICLSREDGHVVMSVSDDGQGIPRSRSAPNGMGLRTMRYRARLIHADFDMETAAGKGTTVRCTIPIDYDHNPGN